MASTAVRYTPSLTIPSTQNTAPIFEFRCLYTHDLRRKAKRWQDGLIRFHTFNRRAMVYDESKNFIGDTHCREQEPIQDGDEIKLDKGVLIQVGESVGSVEQDLTELLQRRSPKASAPFVNEPARPEPHHTHPGTSLAEAFTQLRPKSLNTLLGTSHGRTGRASLPAKSPYDRRNEHLLLHISPPKSVEKSYQPAGPSGVSDAVRGEHQREDFVPDRPAKRQKVSNQLKRANGSARSGLGSRMLERNASIPSHLPSKFNQKALESRETITIDSDEPHEPELEPFLIHTTVNEASRSTKTPRSPLPRSPLNPPTTLSVAKKSPPKNPLRLVSGKPRKKLMYRELLPEVSSSTNNTVRRGTHFPSPRSISPRLSSLDVRKEKTKKKDHLTDFHEAQQKRVKKRLKRRQSNDEPLFLASDDDLVQSFPSVDNGGCLNVSETSISRPSAAKYRPPDRIAKSSEESQRPLSREGLLCLPPQNFSGRVAEVAPLSADEASLELARMDEILLSRPKPRQPTGHEKPIASPFPVVISSNPPLDPNEILAGIHIDPKPDQPPDKMTQTPPAAATLPAFQPQQPRACATNNQSTTAESSALDPPSSPPAFQQHEHHSFTKTPAITIAIQTLPAFQPQHPKPATARTEVPAPQTISKDPPLSPLIFHSLPPKPTAPTESITTKWELPTNATTLLRPDDLPPPPLLSHSIPLKSTPHDPSSFNPARSKRPLQKSTTQIFKPPTTVAKRTLKKAISDSTGLQSIPSAPAATRDDDLGPWSREAFDLFGFGGPGDVGDVRN